MPLKIYIIIILSILSNHLFAQNHKEVCKAISKLVVWDDTAYRQDMEGIEYLYFVSQDNEIIDFMVDGKGLLIQTKADYFSRNIDHYIEIFAIKAQDNGLLSVNFQAKGDQRNDIPIVNGTVFLEEEESGEYKTLYHDIILDYQ